MSCLQISIPCSSSSPQKRLLHACAATKTPKLLPVQISLPRKSTSSSSSSTKLVLQAFDGSIQATVPSQKDVTFRDYYCCCDSNKSSKDIIQLCAILKVVADNIEVHKNVVEQQRNDCYYLNSLIFFTAAKGMLLTRAIDRVLALEHQMKVLESQKKKKKMNNNGWTPELEKEMRDVIEVMKRKAMEKSERLVLNINRTLAILAPLLTLIAGLGSALAKHGSCWAGTVAVMAGALADSIKEVERGGQVGMVFEMYRNCGGFFKFMQDTIEATLEEEDFEKRENGELFEMRVAKRLGRSVSQLRRLAAAGGCELL